MYRSLGILPLLLACTGENVIDKQSNAAPVVLLVSHSDGAEIQEGYIETFRATVSDDDNEFSEIQLTWYVGEEKVCDSTEATTAGESFCDIVFSTEDSNVIVEARDLQGAGGRAEIEVFVIPTEAPSIILLTPEADQQYYANSLIQFSAFVSDQEDRTQDLIVSWSSSRDGEITLDTRPDSDNRVSDFATLSEGQHAIELRVEDLSGKITTEEVVIQVNGANLPPSCQITEPADLSGITVGDSVLFQGTASDENVLPTELTARWSSSIDGNLGEGELDSNGTISFTHSDLSVASHVITLQVEDDAGAICEDTIVLTVGYDPEVMINTPSDGALFRKGEQILFVGNATDADEPSNQLSVRWSSSMDGELMVGMANSQGISQFSSASLSAGTHSITFAATDSIGLRGDDIITFHVNTAPEQPQLSITPDPVYSNSTLTATASGSFDAEGDPVTYAYEWYEGTTLKHTTNSVPASDLDIGDFWTVRVTPNDGFHDGEVAEATVEVVNAPPSLTTPEISSSDGTFVYTQSTVTCSSTASDPDEEVQESYEWLINGVVHSGATVDLSTLSVQTGSSISCTASVSDSAGAYTEVTTERTLDNSPPTINGVLFSPTIPDEEDVVTCSADISDDDPAALSFSFNIYNQTTGEVYTPTSGADSISLDLSTVSISIGDTLVCEVTVTDVNGSAITSEIAKVISEPGPDFTVEASISPASGVVTGSSLSCSASATDPDGVTPSTITYEWNVNGSTVFTHSSDPFLVTASITDVNDTITCSAVATDTLGRSRTNTSAEVSVENSLPVISEIIFAPFTPEDLLSLTATAQGTDNDEEAISYTYDWYLVDNSSTDTVVFSETSSGSSTIDGSYYEEGDQVYVIVTPSDSHGSGESVTSTIKPIPVIERGSCQEYYNSGFGTNGTYSIERPNDEQYDVYCDMETDDGGWMLVGSAKDAALADIFSEYYSDLSQEFPTSVIAANQTVGVWNEFRGETNGDIRFTCHTNVAQLPQVDLSFYDTDWYDEITTGSESSSCFYVRGQSGQAAIPERRNNLTEETRSAGEQWENGPLVGEDTCGDAGDFFVDFDDGKGGESEDAPQDDTNWGAYDYSQKCGSDASETGVWQIWVR